MKRKTKFITRYQMAKTLGVVLVVALAMVLSMGTGLAFDPPDPRDPVASDLVDLAYIEYMLDEDMPPYDEARGVWDPRPYSGALWDYFQVTDASGTGVFDTYLLLNPTGPGGGIDEKGLNTGGKCDDYDEGDSHTSALPLSAVPIVDIDGSYYREFCIDVNESASTNITELISLEVCQIWQSDSDNLCGQFDMDGSFPDYYFPTNPEPYLVYDLDWEHNYTLILDYGVNSGSGKADYKLFVPNEWFDIDLDWVVMVIDHGNIEVQYPTLYDGYGNSDGFEEWGVRIVEKATKEGTKFHDLNADGVWDPDGIDDIAGNADDEVGLSGWIIYADLDGNDQRDPGEPYDETDGNGAYSIPDLYPVTYTFREDMTGHSGWLSSYPSEVDADNEHTVALTPGQVDTGNNFGNYQRGCLEVTKEIDWGEIIGDHADVPDVDFTVTVTGPSYPSGTDLIFHLVNGVVTYDAEMDATACLCDLIPGDYYVTEIAPAGWEDAVITNDDPATVAAGTECGVDAIEVIVTNEPTPGCLEVTKEVDFSGIIGDPADVPDVDFIVTVTGPSYPGGHNLTFHLVDGVVEYDDEGDATACLCGLIPGDYHVTETPPAGWIITGEGENEDQLAVVAAGTACNDTAIEVVVPNAPTPGCLEVTKEVDFSGIIGDPADVPDVDFTVTVTGPSYPTGTDLVFHLVDGVVTYDDDDIACLCDLIPGNYTAEETAPAGWEDAVIAGSPALVEAGDECDDGAALITVTNEPTPGCLEVQKLIDWGEIIGDHADVPDVDFTVTVTGLSYPTGTDLVFHLVDGVVTYDDDDTACLCDLIPGNYTATETAPAGWEDAVIAGSPALVEAGDECDDGAALITVTNEPTPGCLEVQKVVDLDDYMYASSANSTFIITVTGPSYPSGYDLTFHLINGEVLAPCSLNDTACLCNLIPGNYTAAETPPAGWDDPIIIGSPATVEAGDECDDGAAVITVANTLLIPHTTISIEADVYETTPGGNVWLYICDTNDGEVPLTDPSVTLLVGSDPPIELVKGDAYWSVGPPTWAISSGTANGDTNDDGILDVDETWCWAVQITLYESSNITVNGHGTDPLGNPVDGPTYPSETGTITIDVGAATRTWGFWKTHLWLVDWMLDPAGGNVTLPINLGDWGQGDMLVSDNCTYMALMWAKQTHNSDGGKREKIDAARVHTAHQALAAIMNYYMPGGAPLPSGITLASIADTLTNGNIKQIRDLGSALAEYNESGDDEALDPSMPPTGKTNNADPQGGRLIGAPCETYWDTPVPSSSVASGGKGKGKNK